MIKIYIRNIGLNLYNCAFIWLLIVFWCIIQLVYYCILHKLDNK